jgi:CRISPR/Cas system-associated exonuclease Cas4 (RecB family)
MISVSKLVLYDFCQRLYYYSTIKQDVTNNRSLNKVSRQEFLNLKISYIDRISTQIRQNISNNIVPKLELNKVVKASNLGLLGKIDLIISYKSYSDIYVFKYKKAPKEGVYSSHKIQTTAYLMILEELGLTVKNINILYLSDKDDISFVSRKLKTNEFIKSNIIDILSSIKGKSDTSISFFKKTKNSKKCVYCSYKDFCSKSFSKGLNIT